MDGDAAPQIIDKLHVKLMYIQDEKEKEKEKRKEKKTKLTQSGIAAPFHA